jgi:PAB-dependent poly(A)-specific ribonuclease subunit 3
MDGQPSGYLKPPPGLHAKEFIPSAATAKPFVPGGSTGGGGLAAGATTFAPSGTTVPTALPQSGSFLTGSGLPRDLLDSVNRPPFLQSGPGSEAAASIPAAGVNNTSNALGLPEEDDLLGISSPTASAMPSKDLNSQAAEMFRAMRPFQQQQQPPGSPNGGVSGASGSGYAPGIHQSSQFLNQHYSGAGMGGARGGSGGGGRGGSPPRRGGGRGDIGNSSSGGIGGGGRGAPYSSGIGGGGVPPSTHGRGGRGRGGGAPIGPGLARPSVAAYAVSHGRMQLAGQFISETVRQDMQQRSYLQSATLDSASLSLAGLPLVVQQYHTLCPLEDPTASGEHPSAALGVGSYIFKGIYSGDGAAYAVRRIDGRQVLPTAELLAAAEAAVERWAIVSNHSNIVGFREIFVSDEIDSTPAIFLTYDYHAGALSLEQAHMLPTHTAQGNLMRNPATETQLWSYLVQLSSALRAIHSAGLVASPATLAPSKVLLMAPSRVRLGAVGAVEVLAEGLPNDISRAQREDLSALGSLLLTLACAAKNATPTLDALSSHFSREFCHVVAGLLASSEGSGFASWRSLVSALGDRIFTELESSQAQVDTLSNDLIKECENGRLARLMFKLNMVLERPELMGDSRWSETADRYLLTLFRDFVFHQVTENGAPAVDWGPIIEALNKADAGVEEKIVLLSRDEASMLVVSYADVKRCLMTAYGELKAAAKNATANIAGGGSGRGHGGYS